MMSSSSAIGLDPAHPEAAEDQPAAIDGGHPQKKGGAFDEEITDQRQHDDAKTDDDEGAAEPEPGDTVEKHEVDRPERPHLTRSVMAEHAAAQDTESEEQHECGKHPEIESPHADLLATHGAERSRARNTQHIDGDPDVVGVPRGEEVRHIARQDQDARRNHDLACDVVNARLTDALNDLLDIVQRLRGFLRIDSGHDPVRVLATSSATAATPWVLPTMRLGSTPSISLTSTDGATECTASAYLSASISSSAAPEISVIGWCAAARST